MDVIAPRTIALGLACMMGSACTTSDGEGTASSTSGTDSTSVGSAPSEGSSLEGGPGDDTATDDTSTTTTTMTTMTNGATDSTDGGDSTDSTDDGGSSSGGEPACELGELIDTEQWDALFLHKDDPACSGGIYTYQGLIDAAALYPTFACEGDEATRRRELAAFLAQISHETTGGWAAAPDGPYSWGLCFIEEVGCENNGCPQYCDVGNVAYPCAPGVTYHGRGAIQLSWNYNYGQAGDALGVDILGNPDLVKDDSTLAIQTALWFWMTEQLPKPSAHDVMVGNWAPSAEDQALGRLPGFGMTTNIINGGLECSMPGNASVADRVGFLTRYVDLLGTDVGDNVDCDTMAPY